MLLELAALGGSPAEFVDIVFREVCDCILTQNTSVTPISRVFLLLLCECIFPAFVFLYSMFVLFPTFRKHFALSFTEYSFYSNVGAFFGTHFLSLSCHFISRCSLNIFRIIFQSIPFTPMWVLFQHSFSFPRRSFYFRYRCFLFRCFPNIRYHSPGNSYTPTRVNIFHSAFAFFFDVS